MHKITLVAAVSMLAVGSAHAAESTSSRQKAEEAPTSTAAGSSDLERAGPRFGTGTSTTGVITGATSGRVLVQSGAQPPAFVPITPFVSNAMVAHGGNDEELERLLREVQEREQRLLQNPEYRDLLRARQRISLRYSHPELPDLLQISKEQANQLLDLLADQQIREQAAGKPALPSHGGPASVQEFIEKNEARQRMNDAEIASLLGDTKFQEWKEYEQNSMARFQVQRLQQVLPPDARLRPDQLRPLVSAIAREQRQMMHERALSISPGAVPDEEWKERVRESQLERMTTANRRILDQCASILSPKQLQHFESLLQQDLDAMSQQQFFLFGRGAVPPTR